MVLFTALSWLVCRDPQLNERRFYVVSGKVTAVLTAHARPSQDSPVPYTLPRGVGNGKEGCAGDNCDQAMNCAGDTAFFYPGGSFKHQYTCHWGTAGSWWTDSSGLRAEGLEEFSAQGDCTGSPQPGDYQTCVREWETRYGKSVIKVRSIYAFSATPASLKATITSTEADPKPGAPYLKPAVRKRSRDFGPMRPLPNWARKPSAR